MSGGDLVGLEQRLSGDLTSLDDFARELERLGHGRGAALSIAEGCGGSGVDGRVNADPATVEQGLARLVLSLVDLLRRLMEKQALRRIDAGSVTDDEIERMGETFLRLDRKMGELKAAFGLQDDDLTLNLGTLGDLFREE